MNASLRALLSGVVDYAGLFPPAALPLDQAIRNYARYRQEPDAWMLGRFVIPAARLTELDAFADVLQAGPPFRFSVLGRGGDNLADYLDGLVSDFKAATAFSQRHVGRVLVDVLETRVPAQANFRWLAPMTAEIIGPLGWGLFVEGGLNANVEEHLADVMKLIAARFKNKDPKYHVARTGFKLRCGGSDASAFPTIEQVAFVLNACREAGAPVKFTAGLHHPIRRFDVAAQMPMHGFVNVFVAGVLACADRLEEEALRAVLADEDAGHFVFTDDGLTWKDLHVSTEEIADARRDFVTSFGSCSFDEPRDDLRALGWM